MIGHPIGKFTEICVEGCAYVGSGNVLKGIFKKSYHYSFNL